MRLVEKLRFAFLSQQLYINIAIRTLQCSDLPWHTTFMTALTVV